MDLTAFDDEFASAEAPSFDEVPDGKYQVRIDSVRLDRSQKGDPMIKWDLIVIAGPHAGRHIFKNSVITPASLPFVKGDLKTLGLELAKFSDLPHRLGGAAGRHAGGHQADARRVHQRVLQQSGSRSPRWTADRSRRARHVPF